MEELTPRKIVEYLDHYIIGQKDAKRAVAVALRNRWRAGQLPPDISREISPKNILLIGPTGVGKTEIARRIASLTHAPFVKVEATKYTEVGYVGRDVESMVRDLVEEAVRLVKKEESTRHGRDAEEEALHRIAEVMWPSKKPETRSPMDIISEKSRPISRKIRKKNSGAKNWWKESEAANWMTGRLRSRWKTKAMRPSRIMSRQTRFPL